MLSSLGLLVSINSTSNTDTTSKTLNEVSIVCSIDGSVVVIFTEYVKVPFPISSSFIIYSYPSTSFVSPGSILSITFSSNPFGDSIEIPFIVDVPVFVITVFNSTVSP